jgi:hypothetical protein
MISERVKTFFSVSLTTSIFMLKTIRDNREGKKAQGILPNFEVKNLLEISAIINGQRKAGAPHGTNQGIL